MGKKYNKDKNLFYKGLRIQNGMIGFKEEGHSIPHVTDIISYYNRILNENKELEKENEELKKEVNELEDENERLENKLWNCVNYR